MMRIAKISALLMSLPLGSGCTPSAPGPNLVIISMDTFRADRVGDLTPTLTTLQQNARTYTRAYASANETLFSHSSLFTGMPPDHFGALDYQTFSLPPDTLTLAATLSREGYQTAAVVAGGHLAPSFGLTIGFQRYLSMQNFSSFQETVPVAVARLEEFAAADRPFFLFVHGYDTHTPYARPGPLYRSSTPNYTGPMLDISRQPLTYERIHDGVYYPEFYPEELLAEDGRQFLDPDLFSDLASYADNHDGIPLTDDDIAFLKGHYDAAVQTADFGVARILAALDELQLSEQTLLFVISDHGEDLMDHGFFNHRVSLHDENLHVPLIVRGPGIAPGAVTDPVSLQDVMPTALAQLGISTPTMAGQDILDRTDAERIIRSVAMSGDESWRRRDSRLIRSGETLSLIDEAGNPLPFDSPEALSFLSAEGIFP